MTKWEPSANQLKAVNVLEAHAYDLGITALCQELGISRQAYYGWFNNEAFCKWFGACWERWFALRLPRLYAPLARMVTEKEPLPHGAIQAMKLLAERFDKGYAPKQRQEISTPQGGIHIVFETVEHASDSDASD